MGNHSWPTTLDIPLMACAMGMNKRLIVVINKMDEKSVNWSKERYDEITKDLGGKYPLLFGYIPFLLANIDSYLNYNPFILIIYLRAFDDARMETRECRLYPNIRVAWRECS